ncbi:hypothetical protein [Gordonia sp. NPDC003376]
MTTQHKSAPVPPALIAYLLALVGFLLLGLFLFQSASGAASGVIIGLAIGAGVAFVAAAISFRIQVKHSPSAGPGTALLAVTTPEEEAHADAVAERERAARGILR